MYALSAPERLERVLEAAGLRASTDDIVESIVVFPNVETAVRAFLSAAFAFLKWYFRKGNWRDGPVGVVAGVYAFLYSFLKYFKAWYLERTGPGRGSCRRSPRRR